MLANSDYYRNEVRRFVAHTRWVLGCSSIFAILAFAVIFLIAIISPLYISEPSWAQALSDATLVGLTIVFSVFAVLSLWGLYGFGRDEPWKAQVRRRLMQRHSVSDEEFLKPRPSKNADLLLRIRRKIAKTLDIPDTKIARDIDLINDLGGFADHVPYWVAFDILDVKYEELDEMDFELKNIQSIDQLATEIESLRAKYRA